MAIYLTVLNVYYVLALLQGQLNVRDYFTRDILHRASEGRLTESAFRAILDLMSSEGVGLPNGRRLTDLRGMPSIHQRRERDAQVLHDKVSQDQVFAAAEYDENSSPTAGALRYESCALRMLGMAVLKDGKPDARKRELIEVIRSIDTMAKKLHPDLEPIVLAKKAAQGKKASPKLPLKVTKGSWAAVDTSYVTGAPRIPETMHAMLQFIGDCITKDEKGTTLSTYGKTFAKKHPLLKWKVGQAFRQSPADAMVRSE
jgi:hypothetical protein